MLFRSVFPSLDRDRMPRSLENDCAVSSFQLITLSTQEINHATIPR
jgi:hypothetical protein